MLDKSLPYACLYMHRKPGLPIPDFPLRQGFRFVTYSDGMDADWARIECSVGEFDSEFDALLHFRERYLPYPSELSRRLLFVEDPDGRMVATANAWWSDIKCAVRSGLRRKEVNERRAWLHWIAVLPQFQGMGLGKAIVARALAVMREVEGDVDVYLRTQTWSYKAINIYNQFGFTPTNEKLLYFFGGKKPREYKKAMRILRKIKGDLS